jgi:hypothetical protein
LNVKLRGSSLRKTWDKLTGKEEQSKPCKEGIIISVEKLVSYTEESREKTVVCRESLR